MSEPKELIPPAPAVTEQEKEDFFKAFLSDQPYFSTEKLFGGKFTIVFRSLDVQQSGDVFEQLRKDQVNQEVSSDATYMMTLTYYRLGQAIESINGVKFAKDVNPDNKADSYIKGKAAILKTWPVFKLSAVAEAFKAFEDKIVHLTREVQDENFWVAAK